jgi:hypothetical protein
MPITTAYTAGRTVPTGTASASGVVVAVVGARFLSQRQVGLLFLCEVPFEDGVAALVAASELDDVVSAGCRG